MSVFWALFWLGVVGFPLIVLLASLVRSSGYEKDTSHIWVYKGSNRKVRDATVRDVWKRNNPGKSWEDHQFNQFIGCSIFLGIAFLGFMIWLSNQIFMLPENNTAQRLFWQIGAPILGGLLSGIFVGVQSLTKDFKLKLFKVLNIVALILVGIGVIGGLVLTFMGRPLPISHHWIWAPVAATAIFLALDALFARGRQKESVKSGNELENWINKINDEVSYIGKQEIVAMAGRYDKNLYSNDLGNFGDMWLPVLALRSGKFDYHLQKKSFFKQIEDLMLNIVRGRSMTFSDSDLYKSRNEIVKVLQEFYFYGTQKFGYAIHSRIKAAMKR